MSFLYFQLHFPVTDTYKEFDDAILEQKPLNWTVNDAKTAYFGPEISPEIRCGHHISLAAAAKISHQRIFSGISHISCN